MREEYSFHPAAELFPLLDDSSDGFIDLVEDIRQNGLIEPIELLDSQILDGRNRYRASQEAGVEPRFRDWTGSDPYHYVISKNLRRRHLTVDQQAAIAMEAEPKLAEETERKRRAAISARRKGETVAKLPHSGTGATRRQTAEMFGVKPSKIRQAKTVATAAPELIEEVKAGRLTMREAEKQVRPITTLHSPLADRVASALQRGRLDQELAAEILTAPDSLDSDTIRRVIRLAEEEARVRYRWGMALEAILIKREAAVPV